MDDGDVTVFLSAAEALVLFDLVHRWEASGRVAEPVTQAQRIALWNLSALLESRIDVVFEADYSERVDLASQRLVDG